MSDKDKSKIPPASAEATPDTETPAKPVLSKDEVKPVEAKPAKSEAKSEPLTVPPPLAPRTSQTHRSMLFGKGKSGSGESKADLHALAEVTGTNSIILAALKAAYGWKERTRLTRAEFLEKREAWLKRPAKEG